METTKRQRLSIIYDFARANGFCKNKKTFAQLIDMNEGNMSNAFNNDNSNYLTDNLFIRINNSIGNRFSIEWLLYGTGDMYARTQAKEDANPDTTPLQSAPVTEGSSDIGYRMRCTELERVIEALKGTIESQKGTIKSQERIIEMLENENESLKKARTHVS